MRKDTRPGYHPRSHTPISSYGDNKIHPSNSRKPRTHNCLICRHPECSEINRKVLDGYRYIDIMRAHPWISSKSVLDNHIVCLGLKDELDNIRQIRLKEILEDIIRAGKPMLDEGKVYPRDMIDAAKALNELQKQGSVKRVWEVIEHASQPECKSEK